MVIDEDRILQLIEDALKYLEEEEPEKAEKLFIKLLEFEERLPGARIGLAQALLMQGDIYGFEEQYDILLQNADTDDACRKLLVEKANAVMSVGYPEAALQALQKIEDDYAGDLTLYADVVVEALLEAGREEEAWNWITAKAPDPAQIKAEHYRFFIGWLHAMNACEEWEHAKKILSLGMRCFRLINQEDLRDEALSLVSTAYIKYTITTMYREAEPFVELAILLDSSNVELRAIKKELQAYILVEKSLNRMSEDEGLFPLVISQAFEWFYNQVSGVREFFNEVFSEEELEELEAMDDEYARGIFRVQKKYPAVYKMFKEDWDELFEEKTAGMNREMKRSLR